MSIFFFFFGHSLKLVKRQSSTDGKKCNRGKKMGLKLLFFKINRIVNRHIF